VLTRLQQFFSKNIHSLKCLKLDRSSSSQAAVLIFIFSSFSTIGIAWRLEQHRQKVERAQIANIAYDYANSIQQKMERTLSVTYALAALVHQYQGIIPNFPKVARDLLPLYPGASALALFTDGVVKEMVALEGKKITKVTIDRDWLEDLNSLPKVKLAKEQAKTSVSVPFSLINDFPGAIGYLPITLDRNQEKPDFWGFTTVIISFPELLREIDLEQLEQRGIAYRLQCTDSNTNQTQAVTTSSTSLTKEPVEETFKISQVTWTLSLTPITGWSKPLRFSLESLLGLFFSFMLAALAKLFLDSKVHAFELEKIAYFDSLTGLPNLRLLVYRLSQIIAHTQRNHKNTAICYLDLDNFQEINARLGSKAGDYLLVRIAKRLQKFLRVDDVIARINDDEFVIVLQDLSCIEEVELILQRIMEAVTSPIVFNEENISVFTSIGVTMYPQDNSNIDTLLHHAEQAMSYSKQNNKGSYTIFFNLETTIAQSSSNVSSG
jgi:diguanylate cyclase (GGDEF)-like protein